jgi:hypothetical protein
LGDTGWRDREFRDEEFSVEGVEGGMYRVQEWRV